MQETHAPPRINIPLATLPAFSLAARTGSLTLAADELHLTSGAVSRQIKALETALGVSLFRRSANSIELTEAGRGFLVHVNSALAAVGTGVRSLKAGRERLVVHAPITLTRRWLIPRLNAYRSENPAVDVAVHSLALGPAETADVVLDYRRGSDAKDDDAVFLNDRTVAVCAPQFASHIDGPASPSDLLNCPVILDTADGWSWRRWCEEADLPFTPKGGSLIVDTDEAAIDACLAGLGIGQANAAFIERELRSGELLELCPDVSAIVGCYRVAGAPAASQAVSFCRWLHECR